MYKECHHQRAFVFLIGFSGWCRLCQDKHLAAGEPFPYPTQVLVLQSEGNSLLSKHHHTFKTAFWWLTWSGNITTATSLLELRARCAESYSVSSFVDLQASSWHDAGLCVDWQTTSIINMFILVWFVHNLWYSPLIERSLVGNLCRTSVPCLNQSNLGNRLLWVAGRVKTHSTEFKWKFYLFLLLLSCTDYSLHPPQLTETSARSPGPEDPERSWVCRRWQWWCSRPRAAEETNHTNLCCDVWTWWSQCEYITYPEVIRVHLELDVVQPAESSVCAFDVVHVIDGGVQRFQHHPAVLCHFRVTHHSSGSEDVSKPAEVSLGPRVDDQNPFRKQNYVLIIAHYRTLPVPPGKCQVSLWEDKNIT